MKIVPFSTLPSMVSWLNDLCEKNVSFQDFFPMYHPIVNKLNADDCPNELIFVASRLFYQIGVAEASIFILSKLILKQPNLPKAWELLGDYMESSETNEMMFEPSHQIICYTRAADLALHGSSTSWEHEDLMNELLIDIAQTNSLEEIFLSCLSFYQS